MYVYHSACVYKVLPIQVPELAIDSLFFPCFGGGLRAAVGQWRTRDAGQFEGWGAGFNARMSVRLNHVYEEFTFW